MMKVSRSISNHVPVSVSRRVSGYLGLAGLFFLLSFTTIYFVHRIFSEGQLRIDLNFLSVRVVGSLAVLLLLYFLADGLRLYCVIRAVGSRIAFAYILKLVFVNIFVSNVTPLATGRRLCDSTPSWFISRQKGSQFRDSLVDDLDHSFGRDGDTRDHVHLT